MLIASALPMIGIACCNQKMLTGPELGQALIEAMKLKDVTQKDVAAQFGIKQPSVSEWRTHGRIAKSHIPKLLDYFSDVVGPDHWGLPFSAREFQMILAMRKLPEKAQEELLAKTKKAAEQTQSIANALLADEQQDTQAAHSGNEAAA